MNYNEILPIPTRILIKPRVSVNSVIQNSMDHTAHVVHSSCCTLSACKVKNNHSSRKGICSLEADHEKAEGLCFGSPSKQPSARRVADCLMVDCRAPLRGSSDWVAAKHLPASRGAPRRQSSYNREVIHRKTSSFG